MVVALEHKDGSAIYTETADGDVKSYATPSDAKGGREAQQTQRAAEVHAVLRSANEVAAAVTRQAHEAAGEGDVATGWASKAALHVDMSDGVTLMGHSFGASTALNVAAQLEKTEGPNSVRAVIASDPWIAGYNVSVDGVATAPLLALLTQSMMYPGNDAAVGSVLQAASERGAPAALYAECSQTRHQEISDYPSLLHPILRFFCMAGARDPHVTHQQQASVAVGFLALAGGLRASASGEHPALAADMDQIWQLANAEGSNDLDASGYVVHGMSMQAEWLNAAAKQIQGARITIVEENAPIGAAQVGP